MKKIILIVLTLSAAVSCIDKNYDFRKEVDWSMTLLPGMTLEQSGVSYIPVDSLYALKECRYVMEDERGDFLFMIPDMNLMHASFTDEQLLQGVSLDKSYIIKTPLDIPQILDGDNSDFMLEHLKLLVTFANPSPYDLEVKARVSIADQACDVSFIAVHELTQCYTVVCDMKMDKLPAEIEISNFRLCSTQIFTREPSSYVLDMDVQPQVPLSFAGGSLLGCTFMSFVFSDLFRFDGHVMEFNYSVSNPSVFALKFNFSIPEEYGMEINMDEIPAGAYNYDLKMIVKCKGSVKDCKENLNVSLQALNFSGNYSTLNSGNILVMRLNNVYFPEGVRIR
ncbi:MAG: hypothetical protein MJY92_03085 [Bacteroidales bacterium]|nr:hypothetical protein [Bacteroidales bacterium]